MQSVSVRFAALVCVCASLAIACGSSTPTEVESDAAKPAKLEVTPGSIQFGSEGSTASFTVVNAGTRAIEWSASESAGWLSLGATSGTLFAGASRTVTATVQRGGLTGGTYTTAVQVSGARGAGSGTVSVSMTVPTVAQPARLEIAPLQVDFGQTATGASVTLKNTGDAPLSWTASENAGWLGLGATSGSLAARSNRTLALSANRTGMTAGTYETQLVIAAGTAGSATGAVEMTVADPDSEPAPEPDPEPEPEPDPDPDPSVLLSGTLIDQFSGQPMAGISVRYAGRNVTTNAAGFFSIAGTPTSTWSELSLSGGGIYARRTYARSGETSWQAVPSEFNMSAFNDIARDEWAPHTVRWVSRPTVYVDSRPEGFQGGADLDQWISEVRSQAAGYISSWTGGTIRPADVIVTSNPPRDFTPGTIVIHFSENSSDYANSSAYIGYARVSWSSGGVMSGSAVWLRYVRYADRPAKRMGILGHELGHAIGFGHMGGTTESFMDPSIGSKTDLSAFDRQAASLMYSRAPGNTSPDTDSSSSTRGSLATSAVAGVNEWVCRDEEERP